MTCQIKLCIHTLRSSHGIDKDFVEDPLIKLKEKMEQKGENVQKLKLKIVTKKQVLKMMIKMKKKQSSGIDGLSQVNLVLGKSVIAEPLTKIINQSITEGVFPTN